MRSVNPPVLAILMSDSHILEDTPLCRKDDVVETQLRKWNFIRELQSRFTTDPPVLHAGDVFDHWKPSPWLLGKILPVLPRKLVCVPGQHDLPQHDLRQFDKSGLHVLEKAGAVTVLKGGACWEDKNGLRVYGCAWGEQPPDLGQDVLEGTVLLWHRLTWHKEKPYPGAPITSTAASAAKAAPWARLIVTGDNHLCFTASRSGALLVNPGSLLRIEAGQKHFQPGVWLWDGNQLARVHVPIVEADVSDAHLVEKKTRDERMEGFISSLSSEGVVFSLSFRKNLETYVEKNAVAEEVRREVWGAMHEAEGEA